mmetsp:Transcript_15024/g.17347  ORF Transcript_15024/g.17347 Transcript_15024/m.17347 type:complete len:139 (+) Transcript_15024:397-813(+)
MVLMNFHAHLFKTEIIGYVSGYIINTLNSPENRKILIIQDANICRGLDDINVDRTKTVELDPESAREQYRKIEERNQDLLGWYHSHPRFDVNPSHIDVANHDNMQTMFNQENKPFVGVIVGTYSSIIDHKSSFTSLLK